jgi:hypothetical protein
MDSTIIDELLNKIKQLEQENADLLKSQADKTNELNNNFESNEQNTDVEIDLVFKPKNDLNKMGK